jgi:predicted esterase
MARTGMPAVHGVLAQATGSRPVRSAASRHASAWAVALVGVSLWAAPAAARSGDASDQPGADREPRVLAPPPLGPDGRPYRPPVVRRTLPLRRPRVTAAPGEAVQPPLDPQLPSQPVGPLRGEEELVELPLNGFLPAVVSLPLGATSPRPVVVMAHGSRDRAEWHCDHWRRVLTDQAFIICPRGTRKAKPGWHGYPVYTYTSQAALKREIEAALVQLQARYPGHADTRSVVFVGHSLGAALGAGLVASDPGRYRRVILVEGGGGGFASLAAARRFARLGGQRVLYACGTSNCARSAARSVEALRKAGVQAAVAHAAGAGHTYRGEVAEKIHRSFAWLVDGDGRWQGRASARSGGGGWRGGFWGGGYLGSQ